MAKKAEPVYDVKMVDREVVDISRVEPNPWNPNMQDPEIFRVLAQSLKEEGFGEPVLVRPIEGNKLQIVNGEHRYRLAKETGMTHIPVAIVHMEEVDAKLATIRRNRTRGGLDTLKVAGLLRDMRKRMSDEDIEMRLGYSSSELGELMAMLDAPFVPFAKGKGMQLDQYELTMDEDTARWLDDSFLQLAGKREKRFEGKPSRKSRGLVRAISLVETPV